jgi:hypothetical protein
MTAMTEYLSLPFPAYSQKYLRIRTKTDGIRPLILNEGQLKLHEHAEAQIEARGFVRTILLKARQWGGSTYIQGRFYRKVTNGPQGQRAVIMTHLQAATSNLFGMTKLYHDMMPDQFRVSSPRPSASRLVFPKRRSSYYVTTAGSRFAGHSDTVQLLHASEFSMWPNAEDHLAGIFQTVPTGEGTEVFIESTAKGMGNQFHRLCAEARALKSDYWFLFVPWFWFAEYSKPVPAGMILTPDDELFQAVHGLTDEQMAFRAGKILEFGDPVRFQQQYPSTPEDAFQTSTEGSYVDPLYVVRARNSRVNRPYGPKIMGIDPSHLGKDRFSVCMRQGRWSHHVGEWRKKRTTESLGKCVALIREHQPEFVFVDQGGPGAGIVDPLLDIQHKLGCKVFPIDFGGSADDPERYNNKREEMYGRGREWLMSDLPVQIDDRDDLQADLTNPRARYDTAGNVQPESKQTMCAPPRSLPSPDLAESFYLTFAYWVESSLPESRIVSNDIDPSRPINWRAT